VYDSGVLHVRVPAGDGRRGQQRHPVGVWQGRLGVACAVEQDVEDLVEVVGVRGPIWFAWQNSGSVNAMPYHRVSMQVLWCDLGAGKMGRGAAHE